MDTPLTTADKIEQKIAELEQIRQGIFDAATRKAMAISEFSKRVSIRELQLKHGLIEKWEDVPVGPIAASTAHKLAEGMEWDAMLEKEESEHTYKAIIATMDSIRAEMNGLQSINRHIE